MNALHFEFDTYRDHVYRMIFYCKSKSAPNNLHGLDESIFELQDNGVFVSDSNRVPYSCVYCEKVHISLHEMATMLDIFKLSGFKGVENYVKDILDE